MFCVNWPLRFYFVYWNNCVLNDVFGACWCTCSLVALDVPELCFWLAKNRKNLLGCIHVFDLELKFCSDINEGKWLQLLFHFIVLMGVVSSAFGMSFSFVLQVSDGRFLVLHFYGNVCNWIPKLIWSQMDWFWRFPMEYGLFRWIFYLYGLNSALIAQLLIFLTISTFFDS